MKGSVRKRGASWYYYFDLGKIDGKRRKKEKGGFRTKKEAEQALTAAITEYHHAGQVFEPTEITVSDYLDQWFELSCRTNLKYNTQLGYLRIIENHLKPRFGIYKLKAITPALLQEYANSLKLDGYSKNHITGILTIFQSALDYAIEPLHYISQNPMKMVKPPKVERKPRERIVLTLEEWERICERFRNTRYYIPLMIGFYTGLRISEVFALTWDDIDFENRTITVDKQIIKRNYGADVRREVEKKEKRRQQSCWYFTTPKTSSSQRTVPFGDTLYHTLKREKEQQEKNESKYNDYFTVQLLAKELDEKGNDMLRLVPVQKCVSSGLPRANMVCIAENGQYTSTDSFKYCARVIHREMQLAFDFHSLRHTHATLLIEAGANIKNVQARLGHTNIKTTLQTYVHNTDKMSEQSVNLFEQITTQNPA